MRFITGISLAAMVPILGFTTQAHACQKIKSCDLTQFVNSADPREVEEFQEYVRKFKETKSKKAALQRSVGTQNVQVRKVNLSMPMAGKGPAIVTAGPEPTTELKFLLRKNFTDIRLFSNPLNNDDAEGAEFSVTRDNVKRDTTWSADAIAALAYVYTVENIHSTFMGFAVAPYIRLNREIHSALTDNNADTTTLGVSGEVAFRNRLFGRSDHLRARVAVIRDGLTSTEIVHATGEWIPTYLRIFGTIPGTFINYHFSPELKAQYDSTTATDKVMQFSGKQESFRLGPEATVRFKAVPPAGMLPEFFLKWHAKITYHWWTELYSNRTNSWLDSSLTYNVDPAGFIGLNFSYKRGRNEETGAQTDLYKIGLTAKLCADVLSMQTCAPSDPNQ